MVNILINVTHQMLLKVLNVNDVVPHWKFE